MNRFKKEAKKKHDEARIGLSPEEIAILEKQKSELHKIQEFARKIHIERFHEEFDFMMDSIVDANERSMGKNPMSKKYIEKVRKKRAALGVAQLSEEGLPISSDTMDLCIEKAKELISAAE